MGGGERSIRQADIARAIGLDVELVARPRPRRLPHPESKKTPLTRGESPLRRSENETEERKRRLNLANAERMPIFCFEH